MVDDIASAAPAPQPRCMWCSAELPSDHETECPSCGATLVGDTDSQVPGVTSIDAAAIIRSVRTEKPRQRSRLLSWFSGDYEADEKPAPPGSLAPPPLAVRREILRLELEAQVANLQAEAGAMAAEDAVESGTPIEETDIGAALAAVSAATLNEAARAGAAYEEGPASAGETTPQPGDEPATDAPLEEPAAATEELPPA
jgi:hypothetical protein